MCGRHQFVYPARVRSTIGWLHIPGRGLRPRRVIALETSIPSLRTQSDLAAAWLASAQGMAGIAHLELGNTARARQLLEQAERDHAQLISAVTTGPRGLVDRLGEALCALGELTGRDTTRRGQTIFG